MAPGLLLCAAGMLLLAQLTPASAYVPLILGAVVLIGLGGGLAGAPALHAALSSVAPADASVTSAMSSTSNQLGASVGTALLSTVAASATASYLASHALRASSTAAIVHGFATATALGGVVLLAGALLVGLLVDADPRRRSEAASAD
jgi:fucose permease